MHLFGPTDDPEFASGELEVHASKATDASVLDLENVIRAFKLVLLSAESECQRRKAGHLVAFNGVLACPAASSANPRRK